MGRSDGALPSQRPVRRWRRVAVLDWVRIGLFVGGVLAVSTGLLPREAAAGTVERVLPLLVFLGAVVVLAELAARAELFDVLAGGITRLARGRNAALFGLCLVFAAATTTFLNLDTTAVLLTPVMIAAAVRSRVPVLPLAMTTVWLANTASLLLPVSNLTNLLAMDRVQLSPVEFAARMAVPQLAALVMVAGCLWFFYWRGNPPRYEVPVAFRPRDRRVFTAASVACGAFVLAVVADLSLHWAALACAVTLVVAFAVWEREALSWSLLPWRLLVFVVGLFLVVDTISLHGLSSVMTVLIGTDPGAEGVTRAAAVGGVLSNVLNNLPVYLAGEAVIPPANHDQLLGLLIGTNVGPLITPWASLATLIWAERCAAAGLTINWRRFMVTGTVTAVLVFAASVGALLLTR
ncbi:arsenic transporter [Antribacter sp. KLBMP9083]|uniref:Arsenic transporter n=1 Tax=Antribacter soli TaxID=2910976 RepID=A0AA41QHR1_9MICO|nr:SLC13 family permease [Antribacter soli]MCF4123398.1 arsenic transporter [Antribacter soli]